MPRFSRPAVIAAALILAPVLSQCSNKPAVPQQDISSTATLTFTPAATEKMKSLGQKAVVEALYYGLPTEASKAKANEEGQITLGEDQVDVDATSQTVKLSGLGVNQAVLKQITGGAVHVVVWAYSSPTAGTANQLDCSKADGLVSDFKAKPAAVACDVAKAEARSDVSS